MHGHKHMYGYDTATKVNFGRLYHDMANKTPGGRGRRGGGGGGEVPLLNFQIFSLIILLLEIC